VGEKNRLSMQDLTKVLSGLGCGNIKTYIQSGNVVLDHTSADAPTLAAAIKGDLFTRLNVDAEVLLLTIDELKSAIDNNPFSDLAVDPATIHLGFLAARPFLANLDTLAKIKSPNEQYYLTGAVFYLYAPDGVGRSKLASRAEQLLGVTMTDRNWRTVSKLWELAQ
jgi:uncharacterized protein (DUF1697 family)